MDNAEMWVQNHRPDLFRAIGAYIDAEREALRADIAARACDNRHDHDAADAADDARDVAREVCFAAIVEALNGCRRVGFMRGRRCGWEEMAADVRRAVDAQLKKNPAAGE